MFITQKISLADLLGDDYINSVIRSAVFYGITDTDEAKRLAYEKTDLFPAERQIADIELLDKIKCVVVPPFENVNNGAPTAAFAKAFHREAAPVAGFGCTRIGEDGRLYLLGKSEHYHASLGHMFNGYKLMENARRLGIPNATHNNTRGYITRLCERELVGAVNGSADIDSLLNSREPHILNRVINLETGSLAAEAGIKLMLARFWRPDRSYGKPAYDGKTPVFLVMGDYNGTSEANYHGTAIITQTFRGLWPELYAAAEDSDIIKIVPVAINDIEDFRNKLNFYNGGKYKTAGFIHEIILMNYGAVRLTEDYLQDAYKLCRQYDTPIMVDEIQSCMWYPGMLLFRLYNLNPDICILGKGFPGGEYPASKILTTAELDVLNQFGALVTNGQEEIASLAYLITMRFASLNRDVIAENGNHFNSRLRTIASEYKNIVTKVEGAGHLAGLTFGSVENAALFAQLMNDEYIDTSAQLYKINCPPAVLFKPPVIASREALDFICDKTAQALTKMTCMI
ncbi:MAG: aminotransferase class III-fold pyridoxal phosphate-dependent enzyme [Eubacteriales bacterium]|nr:aminotransferase class III-fold pyridoxal phosphate-dependent enzyme [Eubacteriales bacterium]